MYVHTHEYTQHLHTFQHSLHVFTKVFHSWVTLHSNDHITHYNQGFLGAPSPQAIVEDLILLNPIRATCDPRSITAQNYSVTFKFYHNGTGINICDELALKVVKNLFHCTERRELLYTTCQLQMLIVGPPCTHSEKDRWCVVIQDQYHAKSSPMHITFTSHLQLVYTVYSHSEHEVVCKHKYVLHTSICTLTHHTAHC